MIKILLSGQSNVGKTTLVKKVIEHMNLEQSGFLTQRMLDQNGKNQGFQVSNFKGKSEVVAHKSRIESDLVVGNGNKVDIEVVDNFCVNEIEKTFGNNQCILIIDEIGPMQAFSQRFIDIIKKILVTNIPILGVIVLDDKPWVKEIKNNDSVLILAVTELNREELIPPLVAIFNSISNLQKLKEDKQVIARNLLYKYLKEGNYLQVKKFCSNAINYFLENKISKGAEDQKSITYIMKGIHLEHIVKYDKVANSYSCDCDLYKGLNQYKAMAGECAHIQSVKLFI